MARGRLAPDPDWMVPNWPVPGRVRAMCTTRSGGVSEAPFDTMNLGDHVGDESGRVARNRERLAGALGADPVFMRQVHGWQVLDLDGWQPPDPAEPPPQADACLSSRAGLVCTVMVADCLPVLLADGHGQLVAAAHAGWRGLAGPSDGTGVLEATVGAMRVRLGDQAPLLAWLGPCIGPLAFEVGDEVRQAFVAAQAEAAACFSPSGAGKLLADLPALARLRLKALGVDAVYGNDGSAPWCTVGEASRFFSHRRDARRLGSSGRMAACIWLDG